MSKEKTREPTVSKEKTREIKVWVSPSDVEGLQEDKDYYATVNSGPHDKGTVEATLLIKEPEKTVTINESQFDEAAKEAYSMFGQESHNLMDHIKEKLFGSET